MALTDGVGVKVLIHTGAASATTFAAAATVFTQTANVNVAGANIIAIADVNGDGLNDLVITDPGPSGGMAPTVNVLLQDPANPGQFLAAGSYAAADANEFAVADINGDGKPDIVVSSGVTHPMQAGVVATNPGVLLQSVTTAGTFGALQDLP